MLLNKQPKFRARQLMQWLYVRSELDFNTMHTMPKALRAWLSSDFSTALPKVESEKVNPCGTIKWLLKFNEDDKANAVETVFIPEGKRGTLCISSQIGCALACQFCATGLVGFYRNLSCAEIIAQVYFARHVLKTRFAQLPAISNVVFMGMGEPLLNENNVFNAVRILLADIGFNLSKHRVTVSTSGIVPALERYIEQCDAALAVSLHAPDEDKRSQIVPINKKYTLDSLLQVCSKYAHTTKRSVTYEYVMLKDVNDKPSDARALLRILSNHNAKVNMIPYNPVDGLVLACSTVDAMDRFQTILIKGGLRTTVRKTRGEDINAACGQLYGRVLTRKTTISSNHYRHSTENNC